MLTEAHCVAAKAIVAKAFDHIYHRDTHLLDLNLFESIEIAVALIYCNERTFGEKHKNCSCSCCTSYQFEGCSDCFECHKHQTVGDLIWEFDTGVERGVELTSEGLNLYFPRKFRPIAQAVAQAQAQGSHFNFTF